MEICSNDVSCKHATIYNIMSCIYLYKYTEPFAQCSLDYTQLTNIWGDRRLPSIEKFKHTSINMVSYLNCYRSRNIWLSKQTLYSLMVTIHTTRFNIKIICILPAEFICAFWMDLGTNNNCCLSQYLLIGFCNQGVACLSCGPHWICMSIWVLVSLQRLMYKNVCVLSDGGKEGH